MNYICVDQQNINWHRPTLLEWFHISTRSEKCQQSLTCCSIRIYLGGRWKAHRCQRILFFGITQTPAMHLQRPAHVRIPIRILSATWTTEAVRVVRCITLTRNCLPIVVVYEYEIYYIQPCSDSPQGIFSMTCKAIDGVAIASYSIQLNLPRKIKKNIKTLNTDRGLSSSRPLIDISLIIAMRIVCVYYVQCAISSISCIDHLIYHCRSHTYEKKTTTNKSDVSESFSTFH